jgi:hypothetical protein
LEKPIPRMSANEALGWTAQGAFDLAAAFENRGDLGRRDAGTAAVRQPQVALIERRVARGIVGL